MAFSQKHSGKVLVPWFNTAEWRSVYNFLTSNSREQMKNALMKIRMWKSRTPLLSAGVEGTLILLETILNDSDEESEAQLVQIYSITLLRFLNICAANSNKQGSFNRTAQRNDLPRWIINIRHDIAHDNKLPSKSMLELALNHSFEWLIEKYWKIQNQTICDYVADVENSNAKILDSLKAYVRLNMNLYQKVDMNEYDEALMEKINYLVSRRYNKSRTDLHGILSILEEILRQALSDPDNKKIASKVAEILVDERTFLATHIEENDEGIEIIPKSFTNLWMNLLNILYENERFLIALLEHLWLATKTENEILQKIASIWLSDIFTGLLKSQLLQEELQTVSEQTSERADSTMMKLSLKSKLEKKHREFEECIEFEALEKLSLINVDEFENKILKNPNRHTNKFIEKVMKFNKNPPEYRKLIIDMMNHMYGSVERMNIPTVFTSISTTNDLSLTEEISSVMTIEDFSEVIDVITEEDIVLNDGRWKVLRDTSMYKNCPLGVPPYQKTE